jgi:hypothetical protein
MIVAVCKTNPYWVGAVTDLAAGLSMESKKRTQPAGTSGREVSMIVGDAVDAGEVC